MSILISHILMLISHSSILISHYSHTYVNTHQSLQSHLCQYSSVFTVTSMSILISHYSHKYVNTHQSLQSYLSTHQSYLNTQSYLSTHQSLQSQVSQHRLVITSPLIRLLHQHPKDWSVACVCSDRSPPKGPATVSCEPWHFSTQGTRHHKYASLFPVNCLHGN